MIKRKIVTTLLAPPISLLFIFAVFFGGWKQPFELLSMTTMFTVALSPFIILYALPVTFLSDIIGKRLAGNVRVLVALAVHLSFGALLGIIFHDNLFLFDTGIDVGIIFATLTAFFFWVIDELLRKNKFQKIFSSKCRLNFAKS